MSNERKSTDCNQEKSEKIGENREKSGKIEKKQEKSSENLILDFPRFFSIFREIFLKFPDFSRFFPDCHLQDHSNSILGVASIFKPVLSQYNSYSSYSICGAFFGMEQLLILCQQGIRTD